MPFAICECRPIINHQEDGSGIYIALSCRVCDRLEFIDFALDGLGRRGPVHRIHVQSQYDHFTVAYINSWHRKVLRQNIVDRCRAFVVEELKSTACHLFPDTGRAGGVMVRFSHPQRNRSKVWAYLRPCALLEMVKRIQVQLHVYLGGLHIVPRAAELICPQAHIQFHPNSDELNAAYPGREERQMRNDRPQLALCDMHTQTSYLPRMPTRAPPGGPGACAGMSQSANSGPPPGVAAAASAVAAAPGSQGHVQASASGAPAGGVANSSPTGLAGGAPTGGAASSSPPWHWFCFGARPAVHPFGGCWVVCGRSPVGPGQWPVFSDWH